MPYGNIGGKDLPSTCALVKSDQGRCYLLTEATGNIDFVRQTNSCSDCMYVCMYVCMYLLLADLILILKLVPLILEIVKILNFVINQRVILSLVT